MIQERCAWHPDGWATLSEVPSRQLHDLVRRYNSSSDPNFTTACATSGGGGKMMLRAQAYSFRDEAIALGLLEAGRRRRSNNRSKKRLVIVVKDLLTAAQLSEIGQGLCMFA
jgi:hypothetical protein